MKKRQINAILVNEAKRVRKIISYICTIVFLSVLFFAFLFIFIDESRPEYISYKEKSDLDYKVFLKENEFFKNNYLEANQQYIASLINYIKSDFTYQIDVSDKNVNYDYVYYIDANVSVTEKSTNNSIYNYNEVLKSKVEGHSDGTGKTNLYETLLIDYNRYNDLIKKFISVYELDNVDSKLTINMYVSLIGDCEFKDGHGKENVITLSIPLTTKTVGIDMTYDLIEDDESTSMFCREKDSHPIVFLVFSVIFFISDSVCIFLLVNYIIRTRTAESIYEKELKRILNNYKSYIQKVNNEFNLKGYQVVKVDSFNDMLEIRDTIQEPILMVENKAKTGVYFLIPSNTKIIYSYGIKVCDIRKQLKENGHEGK